MEDIMNFKNKLIELNKAIEEGVVTPSYIEVKDNNDAYINIRSMALNTAEDYFLYFASLNLINAYVKKDYAALKNYSFKEYISKGVEALIKKEVMGIKFSYNKQLTVIDIKGLQFSFHNSEITEEMQLVADKYEQIEWEGIRLQPVALEIYNYAKDLDNLSNTDVFGGSLQELYDLNNE